VGEGRQFELEMDRPMRFSVCRILTYNTALLCLMTFDRIVSSPDVLSGAPRIKDTRISVSMVLEWIASGASREEILEAYPHLEAEDIEQATRYAARFLENEVIETAEIPE
jgi:uncharacterized protein (DUF433 family)